MVIKQITDNNVNNAAYSNNGFTFLLLIKILYRKERFTKDRNILQNMIVINTIVRTNVLS